MTSIQVQGKSHLAQLLNIFVQQHYKIWTDTCEILVKDASYDIFL